MPAPKSGDVLQVESQDTLNEIINTVKDKLVIVDFFATWCGPCMGIAPHYKVLATEYTNAVFLKVDVDQLGDAAEDAGVSALPTFIFYLNGEKVGEFTGSSDAKLRESIDKFYQA